MNIDSLKQQIEEKKFEVNIVDIGYEDVISINDLYDILHELR